MSMKAPGRTRAFLLLECLVYISLLLLVAGLAFAAFYRVEEHTRRVAKTTHAIAAAMNAGERWREKVRSATGAIRIEESQSEQRMILPDGGEVVTYVWRDGAVWRRDRDEARWTKVLEDVVASRMVRENRPSVEAWRWELEMKASSRKSRLHPLFTFYAAVERKR